MTTKDNNKLRKFIPDNITSVLAYIDSTIFPFEIKNLSERETSYILTEFIKSGKTLIEIKTALIEVVDGKENEFTEFINTYHENRNNLIAEEILMITIGVFISFIILKVVVDYTKIV